MKKKNRKGHTPNVYFAANLFGLQKERDCAKNVKKLSMNKLQQFGFVRPTIKIEDHIFGVVDKGEILQPSGQWDSWLPAYEAQADKYETFGCTIWGTQNAYETLFNFLFGKEINADERYNYNLVSITPPGGDPNAAAQSIRDDGLTFGLLPLPNTLAEFCTPRPMTDEYKSKGHEWRDQYEFFHQWVLQGHEDKGQRMEAIKDALQYSPLGVSVTAWFLKDNIYVDNGQPNYHWCVCYGWTEQGWKIFDSYDHSTKVYSFDAEISFAKRYHIEKIDKIARQNWILDLFQRLLGALRDLLTLDKALLNPALNTLQSPTTEAKPEVVHLPTPREQLQRLCIESIGKDASPKNKAPQDRACAESLSTLLNKIWGDFKITLSTADLFLSFKTDDRFKSIDNEEPWSIIISPTQGTSIGHCGVIGADNKTIYSNNSKTGLWDLQWVLGDWVRYYREKLKLKTFLFKI